MARYIDADKAIEEARLSYCKDCNSYNGVRCSACGFDDAMTYIEDTPTADVVEVKHGKWKGEALTCSVCDRNISEIYDADSYMSYGIEDELKYCPYCGAKMDGGAE